MIRIFAILLSILLSACSSTSHVLIGQERPPISPEQVVVYTEPPAEYEKIAILQSSSRNSWTFTEQGKVDAAIERMKQEAAKLGANGVLLESTGDEHSGYISTGTGTYERHTAIGIEIGMPLTHKTAQGIAIWVAPTQPDSN